MGFCSPEFQSKNTGKGSQKKREGTIPTRKSTCHFFCSPEFQSKNTGKGSQKKKEKEPFQQENLRATSSVLPNFNLKTLEKGAPKKNEGTIPTRKSTCHFFCSPEFHSKNIGR